MAAAIITSKAIKRNATAFASFVGMDDSASAVRQSGHSSTPPMPGQPAGRPAKMQNERNRARSRRALPLRELPRSSNPLTSSDAPFRLIQIDVFSRQAAKSFEVFRESTLHNVIGKAGCGSLFVPLDALKIVAHELLVERRLSAARLPSGTFPKTRRIRRKHFIGKHNSIGRCCQTQTSYPPGLIHAIPHDRQLSGRSQG